MIGKTLLKRASELLLMLAALISVLFLLLRATGDPAASIAGQDADPATIAAIRQAYGLDQSLAIQYLRYVERLAHGDFGVSLTSGDPALTMVMHALPGTLLLAGLAMAATILVGIPLGIWLGAASRTPGRRAVSMAIYVLQGTPGFVIALVLVQIFAISTDILPAMGFGGPQTWILPAASLSIYLAPKLARVLSVNIADAIEDDYVRTARSAGASPTRILLSHITPNALLGSVALIGSQFAHLIGGALVIETIFAWPGIGRLLVQSTLNLDFPVVQSAAIVIAILVFAANTATDAAFVILDPRLRERAAP
ncbi:MAG: ABC transporter permease [Phenylobacterium sp.]|nr:ABC transporter permease [Phenylobacterium sp.]